MTLLNFCLLVIYVVFIIYIYNTEKIKHLIFTDSSLMERKYLMNKEMYLLMFITYTALFFLGSFSLLKYGITTFTIILLILRGRVKLKFDSIVFFYILFYIWLIISFSYSTKYYEGFMFLIKYLIPLLFLWLSYSAIKDKFSFYFFLKGSNKSLLIYSLTIGGVGMLFFATLYPLYASIFLLSAGMADFYTALSVIPVIMFFKTKKNIYLITLMLILGSAVLESVRTGIGGILIVISVASFFYYKIKSLPFIFGIILVFISLILFVPSINEKMFGDKAGKVTTEDIIHNNALSLENVQTSGRENMWNITMKALYEPNKIVGAGLGEVMWLIKDLNRRTGLPALLHSDYVQILCDSGNIGLYLLILFYISIIIKVVRYVFFKKSSEWVKLTGIMAVSSMAGIAFSMGFDNVVSHSMTSLIFPFIFIGFFLKFIDLEKAQV